MRSSTKTTGVVLSAVLVSSAAAAPALAAQGPAYNGRQLSANCQNDGPRTQGKHRAGPSKRKAGPSKRKAANRFASKKSGTLTDKQKAELAAMAEEEKLAHDVYVTLATSYPDSVQFVKIPEAESRHLDAVRRMLDRYGIADPTLGMATGEFATPAVKALFNDLVAQATTRQAAYDVGITIEKQDIADLKAAQVGLKAPDVRFVYNRLLQGSSNHLRAFGG